MRLHHALRAASNQGSEYALSFDGVDDWVDFGDLSGSAISNPSISGQISFGGWFYVRGGYYLISSGSQTESIGVAFSYQNGTPFATLKDGSQHWQTYPVIPLNEWHHWMIVWDGATLKVYKDAVLVNEDSAPTSNSATDLDTKLTFGVPNNVTSNYHSDGLMSDQQFWNTALTQQEIQDVMNKELTGNEAGLVAYYPMKAGAGTTLYDYAGTNNGTIYGATWVEL